MADLLQTASIRLTPALTPDSLLIIKRPISERLLTCVPPQSSTEASPMLTTLTSSPYFSPKRAIAPAFLASSTDIISVFLVMARLILLFTHASTCSNSWAVTACGCEKSKRKRLSSLSEPAWAMWSPKMARNPAWSRWVAEW